MSSIIKPGDGFLFMKVGTHANETLESIIARKTMEIEQAGFAMWGYGGNTCHPQTMVQPFAAEYEIKGQTIFLCMEAMNSQHFAEQIRADEFSIDGRNWREIDPHVNVLGSRYALVIKNLRREDFDLSLANSEVALGNSQGMPGDHYIRGRVDKACLLATGDPGSDAGKHERHINLVAEIVQPYAVYVRNRP